MDDINISKLKQQLKEGTFYYDNFGLFIKSKVISIEESDKDFLKVDFENGVVDVLIKRICKIRRPSNIIAKFEWCYMFKNEYDDIIGYIGALEE